MSIVEKEYHENYKFFSQTLLAEINKTGNEILNSIKVVSKAYWNKMSPSLCNHLILDLQVAVHNFQKIEIKANAAKYVKFNLKSAINIFSKIAYELQTEFGKDLVIPKCLLEAYIPQIIDVAQILFGIIADDELHEYKDEQIELLNEILFALTQVSAIFQMENPDEIKNCVERKLKQLNRVLDDIDFNHPDAFENLKRHANRANAQTPKAIHHLFKQSKNDNGKLKFEILNFADVLHLVTGKFTVGLQELRNAREAAAQIRYIYNLAFTAGIELITCLAAESKNLLPDKITTLARYFDNVSIGTLTRDIAYFYSDSVVSAQKQ